MEEIRIQSWEAPKVVFTLWNSFAPNALEIILEAQIPRASPKDEIIKYAGIATETAAIPSIQTNFPTNIVSTKLYNAITICPMTAG